MGATEPQPTRTSAVVPVSMKRWVARPNERSGEQTPSDAKSEAIARQCFISSPIGQGGAQRAVADPNCLVHQPNAGLERTRANRGQTAQCAERRELQMGSGGSRFGAGRPAQRIKAEHCRSIDVRRWQRERILRAGASGTWGWSNSETGERTSTIGYRVGDDFVNLDYAISGKASGQRIALDRTACTYGGTRAWFVCPIRGERVAVLYLRAGRFACRHCQRIAYASQSGDVIDRTWRRQRGAEARLIGGRDRPVGMHRRTFERIKTVIADCEAVRSQALGVAFGALLRRYPRLA